MLGGVVEELRVEGGDVGDPLAVQRPGRVIFLAGVGGHLEGMLALVFVIGGHNPNVPVIAGVGVRFAAVAGERQQLAVRRPSRIGVVVVAGGHLCEGFGGDIENVQMRAPTIQIADRVGLEQQPVNYPGPLSLGLLAGHGRFVLASFFPFVGRRLKLLLRGITEDQNESLAVGSPFKRLHILNRVGQALCFAA